LSRVEYNHLQFKEMNSINSTPQQTVSNLFQSIQAIIAADPAKFNLPGEVFQFIIDSSLYSLDLRSSSRRVVEQPIPSSVLPIDPSLACRVECSTADFLTLFNLNLSGSAGVVKQAEAVGLILSGRVKISGHSPRMLEKLKPLFEEAYQHQLQANSEQAFNRSQSLLATNSLHFIDSSNKNWVADEKATNCTSCMGQFSLTKRRHHCR
jgi:hypothetical protein